MPPAVAPRLFYDNLIQADATVIVPSSEEPGMPRGRLRFPLRSDIWRTNLGWTFAEPNRHVDFTEDGNARIATLSNLSYLAGADMATAVQAAMNAAPGAVNTYTVTYDPDTKKVTIARATGTAAVVLKFGDGANLVTSIHLDLGYTDGNKTGGTSYVAENVTFQSRHWLHADFGAALASQVCAVINHNLSTPGTIRLDGHTASMLTSGLASAPGGAFSQPLPGDATLRHGYFSLQSKQFMRLVISDVQNPSGFAELGIAFVGPHLDLRGFAPEVGDDHDPLSEVAFAVGGAHWQTERQKRRGWRLRFASRTPAERDALLALQTLVTIGRPFFFDFDINASQVRYVFFDRALSFDSAETDPVTWDIEMRLPEALG